MKLIITSYMPTYNYNHQKNVVFKAHPDYDMLEQKYPSEYNVSSYFRHGIFGIPSGNYKKIIDCFEEIFSDSDTKKTMLIGGIGDSQEPFSHLASIKSISKKTLNEVLDLNIVDIKDKPDDKTLLKQSFYSGTKQPMFAKDSFIQTQKYRKLLGLNSKYRVKKEIFDYLQETYSNPEKSKWETRIQDAVKDYPDESFDIISLNNVIQYVEDKEEAESTLQNIVRILKPNGIFITDSFDTTKDVLLKTGQIKRLSRGIYKKDK